MKTYVDALKSWWSKIKQQTQDEADWLRSRSKLATKQDLISTERNIMSAISEFAVKQAAFNERVDVAIAGITGDIVALNALIVNLQNTPGPISAEDQATLDALEAKGAAIAAQLEALDAVNPPAV